MPEWEDDSTVLESRKSRVDPPPLYRVLLLNDDYTPMDFVVEVLRRFFGKDEGEATMLMLRVHREGSAVVGLYPRDIAETKVGMVVAYAQEHGHPLQCVMEKNQA